METSQQLSGASVLDLAKYHMFDFHYNVMRRHLNCHVLHSDTDSLVYEIKHTDSYYDLGKKQRPMAKHFNLSNYPKDHELINTE